MAVPLGPPPRKNPLKRTRLPALPPEARSRQAHLLTRAAAEGRFGLPACLECGKLHYPPRDCCPECLSPRIGFRECSGAGVLAAATEVLVSNLNYFRERAPWRTGLVTLDAGPGVIANIHADCIEGARARLEWRLDKSGNAAAFALPEAPSPAMMDSPEAREMSLDPKHRRILVTDARGPLGLAVAKALLEAGAAIVFCGISDAWKPFPGREALAAIPGVELVNLDITSGESVNELAAAIGARVDIIVNTGAHIRPGGVMERRGAAVAREELETGYLGLMRLAQAFGPVMTFRGADGANSASAIVNVLSIHAQMPLPQFGAWSASQAALYAASLSLRAELRGGGIRIVNIFTGPTDDDWFQMLPPPKVTHARIASAVTDALHRGLEDVYCGDVAQDFRARLELNPKALERELGQ